MEPVLDLSLFRNRVFTVTNVLGGQLLLRMPYCNVPAGGRLITILGFYLMSTMGWSRRSGSFISIWSSWG